MRKRRKAKCLRAGKAVSSFPLCVSKSLNRPEQRSPEVHITQTVSATRSKTWPTNLRTLPVWIIHHRMQPSARQQIQSKQKRLCKELQNP